MNVNTGATYESFDAAVDAGEDPADIVEVVGTREQVEALAENVRKAKVNQKASNRAKNKAARKSRRKNRA